MGEEIVRKRQCHETSRLDAFQVQSKFREVKDLNLPDLETFSNMIAPYENLARRIARYSYIYQFVKALAAILHGWGGILGLIAAPIALFIATIGTISVIKAIYVDKMI